MCEFKLFPILRFNAIIAIASLVCISERVSASDLPQVMLSLDGSHFVQEGSGGAWTPWGHNYASVDILERMRESPEQVARDFEEMRDSGTTVVRIHPEMPKLLTAAGQANQAELQRLKQLIDIAEEAGVYLQITGLACYKISDRMDWYDAMDQEARWATQAFFWETVAMVCADSPAVFAYDLINEPAAIGPKNQGPDEKGPGYQNWYTGRMGDVEFCQRLTLEPTELSGDEIFRQWTTRMVAAIRKHDPKHLITMGMLPFPGAYRVAAEQLDFVSPHLYPENGAVAKEIQLLHKFDWGKPIVIGETFPLKCDAETLKQFLLESRSTACGWLGHWPDQSPAKLASLKESGEATIKDAIWLSWVQLFRELGSEMKAKPKP